MAIVIRRTLLILLAFMPCQVLASELTDIDVHQGEHGALEMDLHFSGGVAGLQSYRLDNPPRLTLDLIATQNGLGRRHIEVNQPGIEHINVAEGNGRTRLVVGLTQPMIQTSQVMRDRLRVSLVEPAATRAFVAQESPPVSEAQQEHFTGERLSLNVQDMDIRAVLTTLAEFSGLNLIASESVTGRITLSLNQVPWDQALASILHSRGLSSREHGNVILIAPMGELAELESQEIAARSHHETLSPIVNEFIEIKYARAEDLAQLLRGDDGLGVLSERGRVSVDSRTNALIVRDTAEQVRSIRRTLARFDVPVRQVQIEARIVIARDTASRELGVNWEPPVRAVLRICPTVLKGRAISTRAA